MTVTRTANKANKLYYPENKIINKMQSDITTSQENLALKKKISEMAARIERESKEAEGYSLLHIDWNKEKLAVPPIAKKSLVFEGKIKEEQNIEY